MEGWSHCLITLCGGEGGGTQIRRHLKKNGPLPSLAFPVSFRRIFSFCAPNRNITAFFLIFCDFRIQHIIHSSEPRYLGHGSELHVHVQSFKLPSLLKRKQTLLREILFVVYFLHILLKFQECILLKIFIFGKQRKKPNKENFELFIHMFSITREIIQNIIMAISICIHRPFFSTKNMKCSS